MSKWISVKDRLPQTGIDVLCCRMGLFVESRIEIGRHDNGFHYPSTSMFSSQILQDVTHWMPLPPCPDDKG